MGVKKVYALSAGSYSDYRVLALFPTRKLAKEAAAAERLADSWAHDADVEEFYLYDEVPEHVTVWRIHQDLMDDGTEGEKREWAITELPWSHYENIEALEKRPVTRFVRAPIHQGRGGRLEVMGLDQTAVRKVFSDRKAEIVAAREGISW
jgi:hypothetical protein